MNHTILLRSVFHSSFSAPIVVWDANTIRWSFTSIIIINGMQLRSGRGGLGTAETLSLWNKVRKKFA